MLPLKDYIKQPSLIVLALLRTVGTYILSDKLYLQWYYRLTMGEPLDLKNPKKLTEKLQWLKLHNRIPQYTTMVDKYAVKQYVAERIGQKYIIPTLGVWDKAEEIDFDILPNRFVLKTTHGGGGGGIIICTNKDQLDKVKTIGYLNRSLKRGDIYRRLKEWPYKNVPRRIIAEQYMEDTKLKELRDYKFFCFNGQCKCFKVDFDRFIKHRANYYDSMGRLLLFGEVACPPLYEKKIDLPDNLNEMIDLANKLSKDVPFLRVDFYVVNGKIYFGELTFFPASGLGLFTSDEWNIRLGSWLQLPSSNCV